MRTIKTLTKLATSALIISAVITMPAFSQGSQKLSDPEVAHVAVSANQIDISSGELAKVKSKNPEVVKFAETMIRDHKAVNEQASALAKKLGVTPKENAVSKQLLSDAEKTKKSLRAKSGSNFDKAYIDNEVAYHKAVISAVEGLLIPETENAELKALLQNILPALQAHLQHAEMLQKQLASK
jgi:putative membrane protein